LGKICRVQVSLKAPAKPSTTTTLLTLNGATTKTHGIQPTPVPILLKDRTVQLKGLATQDDCFFIALPQP
jgi:hypothetical protein